MLRALFSFFGAIFSFITNGAVLGVLIVGAIFWMYGRDLPSHDQLANYAPPTISRVYSGQGALIDEFAEERRLFVPANEIPDLVKEAFISAEDKNFYIHRGYDPVGMIKAGVQALEGHRLRGASTITQQVMKNFLLSSDRSAERKIKEIILASRVEDSMSKDKILELYLNEIYLGQNSYGVAAAAQTYFNKTLDQLSPEEAAYLAALPKSPSDLHPVRDHDAALARRDYVLQQMYLNGYLDKAAYDQAVAKPLLSVQGGDYPSFRQQLPPRGYFTDEVRRQLSQDFGKNEFFTGGLSIRSTLDPKMQKAAELALQHQLESYDRGAGIWRGTGVTLPAEDLKSENTWRDALAKVPTDKAPRDIDGWQVAVVLKLAADKALIGVEGVDSDPATQFVPASDVTWARKPGQSKAKTPGDLLSVGDVVLVKPVDGSDGKPDHYSLRQVPLLQGAFMAMDVNTGRVLALQGGFDYQTSVFDRATQATRQPGSSFKPFVYAAALDSGYTPATIVVDAPIEKINDDGTVWQPKNDDNRFYGPVPMRIGIEQSRNLMTIRLAEAIGMKTVAKYAENFGVYDHMQPYLANSIGSQETTLWRMVSAYAMFANGGERVDPTLVDRVQDRYGRTVYRHDASERVCTDCDTPNLPSGEGPTIVSNRQRVMDPITAYQLTSMMQGVVQRGTASRTVNLPVPIAGKTGTTNDGRDLWFIGFSSNIVAGCFVGYDTPRPIPHGFGGSMCGPVFNEFMKTAIAEFGGGPFKVPPGGHFINIDRQSGLPLPADASGPNVQPEYFRDGVTPVFGLAATVDGGFKMGENLPLYTRDETVDGSGTESVTNSNGEVKSIPKKATFGQMSSGGLY